VSLHDAFLVSRVVKGGSLRSTTWKDPEGSKDRRSMLLRQFDIREFGECVSRLSLRTTSDLSPRVPSIYNQDLLWLARALGKTHAFLYR
jgi:hypothetical protein